MQGGPASLCHSPARFLNRDRVEKVELNRNNFFMIGVFLLLFGTQFRLVGAFTLTDQMSHIVSQALKSTYPIVSVVLPKWFGWISISLGGISCLHALAMPK